MVIQDFAVLCRPIPLTDWNLVFTRTGKYFFHNKTLNRRVWRPPADLFDFLTKRLSRHQLDVLFDPFNGEEIEIEDETRDETEDETEYTGNECKYDERKKSKIRDQDMAISIEKPVITKEIANEPAESKHPKNQKFQELLLNDPRVDPYAPWPRISEIFNDNEIFLAIKSDKQKQAIFSQLCPTLIAQRTANRSTLLQEAREWWLGILNAGFPKQTPWSAIYHKFSNDPRFQRLNMKECEKEFYSSRK